MRSSFELRRIIKLVLPILWFINAVCICTTAEVIRIMIIEDEQDLLNLYKDFLVNKGYHISVTNTTASNIMRDYEEFRPDLVILDYKLPDGKNGLEAANEIFAKYPFASILIISAYDSVKQAFNNEKKFVSKNIKLLIKPFKLAKLNELTVELVNRQTNKRKQDIVRGKDGS